MKIEEIEVEENDSNVPSKTKKSITNQIDSRNPKEILKSELYLTAPMIRRILNCTYHSALQVINEGLKIEEEKKLFIVEQKQKKIRTTTFKEMTSL